MEKVKGRYRVEEGKTCIDLVLKNPLQLFDARDPAPFLERDLDDDAVKYILSAVEEFHQTTPLKLRIFLPKETESTLDGQAIREAIHTYFAYEADLLRKRLSRALRTGQFFLLIGIISLVLFLTLAELASRIENPTLQAILREGLVITGWVAMWRPLELILYDWWPLFWQKRFHEKLSTLDVDVRLI